MLFLAKICQKRHTGKFFTIHTNKEFFFSATFCSIRSASKFLPNKFQFSIFLSERSEIFRFLAKVHAAPWPYSNYLTSYVMNLLIMLQADRSQTQNNQNVSTRLVFFIQYFGENVFRVGREHSAYNLLLILVQTLRENQFVQKS